MRRAAVVEILVAAVAVTALLVASVALVGVFKDSPPATPDPTSTPTVAAEAPPANTPATIAHCLTESGRSIRVERTLASELYQGVSGTGLKIEMTGYTAMPASGASWRYEAAYVVTATATGRGATFYVEALVDAVTCEITLESWAPAG